MSVLSVLLGMAGKGQAAAQALGWVREVVLSE